MINKFGSTAAQFVYLLEQSCHFFNNITPTHFSYNIILYKTIFSEQKRTYKHTYAYAHTVVHSQELGLATYSTAIQQHMVTD